MIFTDRKTETLRTAVAEGCVRMSADALRAVREKRAPKGDVLEAARAAGMLAAKKTSELIPHCHFLPLDGVSVGFTLEAPALRVTATVRAIAKTGVEMEALTSAAIAALTVYDMCKAIDKSMVISDLCLLQKRGGRGGPA
jgi:cyclic pyranopterin phosphate synthase